MEIKKRGYLANYKNYREWFDNQNPIWRGHHLHTCKHCGRQFIPNSPNQIYCGKEDKNGCYKERNNKNLMNGKWFKFQSYVYTSFQEKQGGKK